MDIILAEKKSLFTIALKIIFTSAPRNARGSVRLPIAVMLDGRTEYSVEVASHLKTHPL